MDQVVSKDTVIQLESGNILKGIEEVETALTELEKTTVSVKEGIASAFSPFFDTIQVLEKDITSLDGSIKKLAEQFVQLKDAEEAKTDSKGLFGGVSEAYTAVTQGLKKSKSLTSTVER